MVWFGVIALQALSASAYLKADLRLSLEGARLIRGGNLELLVVNHDVAILGKIGLA